jgi:transposase-like protein
MKKTKETQYKGKWSPDLKREIGRRYEAGDFSMSVAAEQYNLPSRHVVRQIINWYRNQQSYLANKDLPVPDDTRNGASHFEQELDKLTKQELIEELKKAKLATQAWKTLVLQSEESLNIQIVKKSGAKPSGN